MNGMKHLVVLVFLICSISTLQAQKIYGELDLKDTTSYHRLTMSEGDVFTGRILSIENLNVEFQFRGTTILNFNLNAIESIEVLTEEQYKSGFSHLKEERQDAGNRQGPRLKEPRYAPINGIQSIFLHPTGFGYEKGTGQYRNTMVLLNQVRYGVSDHFSVGGSIVPSFAANIISLDIKGNVSIAEFVHLSAGINTYFLFLLGLETFGASHAFSAVSIGTPDYFLNIGAGYGFGFLNSTDNGGPVFSMSGSFRTGDRWRAFGEGLVFSASDVNGFYLLSTGMSWFNLKDRVDFGFTFFPVFDGLFPVPFVSYSRRFGKI